MTSLFLQKLKSNTFETEKILQLLYEANMRVASAKLKFFKEEVEFLGFVVSSKGIKTCPDKVKGIVSYQVPRTLRSLLSFLGFRDTIEDLFETMPKSRNPLQGIYEGRIETLVKIS